MSEIQKISGEGAQPPAQTPPPTGEGDTLSPQRYNPPPQRLWHLDSRAFGARPRRLRRLDPPICAMTNITYFRPCVVLVGVCVCVCVWRVLCIVAPTRTCVQS